MSRTTPAADRGRASRPRPAGAPEVETVFREEFGRVVATLVKRFGDIDLAEEMAQEAFVEAMQRWPRDGVPPNPGAWLTTTARNRGIDRLRRESHRDAKQQAAYHLYGEEESVPSAPVTSVTDERLRLLFTCCHPALAADAQVALTLRLLGGLTVPEVADAFLVPERTMAQRITRAKRKIKAANIPFRVPRDADLPDRLRGVLGTIFLVFNEGYLPQSGEHAIRTDLCHEAIRLGRVLRGLMPDEPEVTGLLALMVLTEARRPARVGGDGVLVPLDEQDRTLWDRALIDEGHDLVRWCLRRNRPGPYQLMAAVNAVHTDADSVSDTDWGQVLALYDQMYAATPTPVVALNRAVVVAELEGAEAGLAIVDGLVLDGYHPFHATRADLLRRLGRANEARAAYDRAIELASNPAQIAFLTLRRDALDPPAG
ncbi:RNA polymerase sigma factor [Luteipulveratus flavus]|uniref:RNA polymerase sigma factor n=1 Tax=Luteipulveratus flavus TaxID=3031728 RepID=A0ABT6CCF4_9MICO|nr:RNA polymerase sigma factor [Luteipulveratus sp. YIM 133296]MDF8266057.1 RNA polymerase sigma factor [Luteipulveratus sp. YIM 133296]